jgi:deoxyribodipyrimidine photolyase-related protein
MHLLLLPTQLFNDIEYIKKNNIKKVWLYEEPKYFTQYRYHKLKLLYHRITCKEYYKWLNTKIPCEYIDYNKSLNANITHMIDPIDHELLAKYKKKYPKISIIESQHFTLNPDDIKKNASVFYSKTGKFNHEQFYKWQRRRLNILVKNGNPDGGRWSFDRENRNAIPRNEKSPDFPRIFSSDDIIAAKKYIQNNFPRNYGEMNLIYPTTHIDAKKWLTNFVAKKFKKFGKYEDASRESEPFLYHSVLTPMLNIGLLTDWDVIDEIMNHKRGIPIASLEGFVRQLIGWRNYMYVVYTLRPQISRLNFFNNKRKLNDKWWTGTTGIDPIDDIIKNKIVKYAYTHHIERLMYLGATMMMCGVHPNSVYTIYMEWTIDAYDWVMIPNIYGMSQYADGGIVMRRPYLSSSNYILKMSNYKRGDWCKKWDAIYYAFLAKNKSFFSKNYYYAVQVKNWESKSVAEKKEIQTMANSIIKLVSK